MFDDFERCYRAVQSRDDRFDGWFFTAVTSTGIYCRPSCPAMVPRRDHVRFYPTAAAAQGAGFRACKRCRPDATPGSPEWNERADLVARGMRLIADGLVDRAGVSGLASRLGYSERHLHRQMTAEVGAGPLALARAQRAQTARLLIETTRLPLTQVAFAAGFASVRQFNDTIRTVFAVTPTALRREAGPRVETAAGTVVLRLPFRKPLDAAGLLGFLAKRAIPGVEEFVDGRYRRTLRLPHGTGVVELSSADGHVACRLRIDDLRDLGASVQRCRRLLDLDADPVAVTALLGKDPLLAPVVQASPGRRVPRTVDGEEFALRAVIGQQISVAGARTIATRLTIRYGKPLTAPDGGLTHLFPEPAALADADPLGLPMPTRRAASLTGLARALAAGDVTLDPGTDRLHTAAAIGALPGIGPWTVALIALRALGDPDAFPASDLGIRRAAARLGMPGETVALGRYAARWRPWRSYAALHLWSCPDPDLTS
ncbi:MAG: helix-turn-helix domain-containing protein [Nitriliruptorales bacterium]|nr:helix-turn-helix domain-containing protein [Nitriliruptorales bacterium]